MTSSLARGSRYETRTGHYLRGGKTEMTESAEWPGEMFYFSNSTPQHFRRAANLFFESIAA
jgi:DNA/RNA endonuclease G (NUC1)